LARSHCKTNQCLQTIFVFVSNSKIENENKALEEVILPRRERVEENQILLSQKAQHLTEVCTYYM
jgi:hypothetical protein